MTQYLIKPDPIAYYAEWDKQTEGDCQPVIDDVANRLPWLLMSPGLLQPGKAALDPAPVTRPPRQRPLLHVNFYWRSKWGGGGTPDFAVSYIMRSPNSL